MLSAAQFAKEEKNLQGHVDISEDGITTTIWRQNPGQAAPGRSRFWIFKHAVSLSHHRDKVVVTQLQVISSVPAIHIGDGRGANFLHVVSGHGIGTSVA